jgi:hypothetical protein
VRTNAASAAHIDSILNRHQPVDPAARRREYEQTGWREFDATAEPYTPSQQKLIAFGDASEKGRLSVSDGRRLPDTRLLDTETSLKRLVGRTRSQLDDAPERRAAASQPPGPRA